MTETFVVVSVADNGVVHAWGPFGTRREAMNARSRGMRHAAKYWNDTTTRFITCKVMDPEGSPS